MLPAVTTPPHARKTPPDMKAPQPRIPDVSLSAWADLYAVAADVWSHKPWTDLDDTDLIGVHDPGTGSTGYACFMGSAGQLNGLCLYRGDRGFNVYRRMVEGLDDPIEGEYWATQDCLKLAYGNKTELAPADRQVIKHLGVLFKGRGAWPEFRSHRPGCYPWHLTEEEARFLTLGLRAGIHHFERYSKADIDRSVEDKQVLVYSPVDRAWRSFTDSWESWPSEEALPPALPVPLARIQGIRSKTAKPDSSWEADGFYVPVPIAHGDRPYYIRVALVCQRVSGHIFHFEMGEHDTPPHTLLGDAFLTSIEKSGFLPDKVYVKGPTESAVLSAIAGALGVGVVIDEFEALEEAKQEMVRALGGRKM